MAKKPFILKDGELILKKPINLDEVPEPPKQDIPYNNIPKCNILKTTLWVCLGLLLFSSILVVALVPSVRNAIADIIIPEEPKDERIYTPSTSTICRIMDGKEICSLTLYSGIRFIFEDNEWKTRKEARSFKNSGIECSVKSDGINVVECLDWNETSRTIKFSQKNTILTQVNVPLRKYTKKYNLTSSKHDKIYKEEFETTIDLDQENIYKTLEIKTNPNEILEYGEHSTTIELQDNDTENLGDTTVYNAQPTFNFGGNPNFDTDNCTAGNCNKEACIKFTLGSLPFNTEIINANLSLVALQEGDKEIEVYELSNQSWLEGYKTGQPADYGINWNTKPEKGDLITSVVVDTLHKRYFWNVTSWTKNQHDSEYSNVSYYFTTSESEGDGTTGFYSAETPNATVRPVLNITYQIVIPLVVNLQSPKNSTSDYTPYINFTYNVTDQGGGDIDNCSLYLQHYYGGGWELNKTDHSITQGVNQTINISLAYENVYWRIDCYADDSSHDVSPAWNYTRLIAYPNIDLQAPADGVNFTARDVSFTYNISYNATIHYGSISECSLWLNGMLNKTDTSIYTPPRGGRVGEWLFDADASDTSGNGNDGVVTGATLTTGYYGQGYSFNGLGDDIDFGDKDEFSPSHTAGWSVSGWFKPNSSSSTGAMESISKGSAGQFEYTLRFDTTTNSARIFFWQSNGNNHCTPTGISYTPNEWVYYYAELINGTSCKLCKNGATDCEIDTTLTGTMSMGTADMQIGERADGNNDFNGTIDEVAIYNRVLTTDEITDLYESGLHAINQTINITLNNSHFYDWLIECKSDGGYKTNSSTYSFLFNNAPTIPTTLSPANETTTVIDSAILSCSGSTDSESDTINYEFWNGTGLLQNSSLSTFNLSMVRPDNYYWKCRANDNLSQSSFTSTRKLTYAQLYANCSTSNSTSAIALNFTFADESNETRLYEISFDSLFTFWGSDRTTNQTISLDESNRVEVIYCISPKNGTVNANAITTYEKTGWKLRYYTLQNYPIIGNSTNKTLYLLATAEGLYVTFQVINLAGNPIDDVFFTAERRVDGTNWETIYSDLTDSAGTTTPFLDPDYPHRFTFSKSGYDTYTTTLTPTQTSYTIELGTGIEVTNETAYTRGIKYNILPVNITLTNNTEYNFTFNISSNYETLTSAGFTLTNSTGDTLATVSCTGDTGCMASTILDVGNNTFITMNYYWVISGTTSGGKKTWNVYTAYDSGYSIMTAFEDAEKLGSGFGDFAKSVISFLIIISIVGVATLKFNLHNYSASAVLFLIFALTGLLDYVGFLPSIPESIPHFIPILMGVISIGYFIYEMRR